MEQNFSQMLAAHAMNTLRQVGVRIQIVSGGERLSQALSPATFANAAQRREAVADLVSEQMRTGLSYGAAFNAVERSRPELFAAMKQPAITLPKK